MKGNLKLLLKNFYVAFAVFITANAAYSLPFNPHIKVIVVKYGITMGAVVVATLILFVGLSLYNKYLVIPKINDYNIKDCSLKTPTKKEEAIISFITKNRLR